MYPEQVDSLVNLSPGIGDILQQLDHFDDRRFVIMQVGLHQASLHIIVQRRQIIGDFTALLVVEAAFQPVVDDVDCLRQRQAFTGDITLIHQDACAKQGVKRPVEQHYD